LISNLFGLIEDVPKRIVGVILVVASALAFSLAGVLTKLISTDAWTIACWRGLIGGLLITGYVAWKNHCNASVSSFRLGWKGWLLATIGSLSSLAFIFAFKLTFIANVAVIYATVPFMAAALGWILLGEKTNFRTTVSAIGCIVGVTIVVQGGFKSGNLLGDGVALLMTAGNALYMVLVRVFRDAPVVFAGAVSALQLFIVGWFVGEPLSVSSTDGWLLLTFGASFAVAVILWTEGTSLIPAAEAGLLGTTETPFTIFLAWLVLSELPPLASLIGGAIVLATVVIHATRDSLARDHVTNR